VFRIEIGAAKDNPEKTKGSMLTEAEAPGKRREMPRKENLPCRTLRAPSALPLPFPAIVRQP